jgi:HD-like signal output (HDOD) protein
MNKGAKLYLASRYARREELNKHAGELENLGYIVTSRWLIGHHLVLDELSVEEKHEKSKKICARRPKRYRFS